jgi:hypothetical protein
MTHCFSQILLTSKILSQLSVADATSAVQLAIDCVFVPLTLIGSYTTPVKDLNLAYNQIGTLLTMNCKWEPQLSANIPFGLWPRILQKWPMLHRRRVVAPRVCRYSLFPSREKADLNACLR